MSRAPATSRIVAAAAALFAVALHRPGLAETEAVHAPHASPASIATRETVKIYLVGRVGNDPKLPRLIGEWFGGNGVEHEIVRQKELRLEDITGARGAPAQIWIAASDPYHVRLYFAEPDTERYLLREVPVPSGLDEIGRERIVQVALSSALAFIERAVASPLDELEKTLEAPKPSPEVPPDDSFGERPSPGAERWRTELGPRFVYGVTSTDADVAHGPGLTLELARLGRDFGHGFRVHGQYRTPREVALERVHVSLQDVVAAASATLLYHPISALRFHVELGGGVQWGRVRPTAMAPEVTARPATWTTSPFLLAGTGLTWIGRSAALTLSVRGDVMLVRSRYEILTDRDSNPQLVLPRLQPGAFLEIGPAPIHL